MTAKWIIFPTLAVVTVGAISFSLARHTNCRTAESDLDRLRDLAFLTQTLQLTDTQTREIEILHSELGVRLKDCCARHCAARKRLGRSLADDDLDADRMDTLLQEMCIAYAESERLALEHIRSVRNLLDSEQRRRFDKLVIDALMCKDCPQACR